MKAPKNTCPYCGRLIKDSARACASHRDLLPLDRALTGWMPAADVNAAKVRHWLEMPR